MSSARSTPIWPLAASRVTAPGIKLRTRIAKVSLDSESSSTIRNVLMLCGRGAFAQADSTTLRHSSCFLSNIS